MLKIIGIILFIACWALVTRAIIKADTKAEAEYQAWYDHPDRVWNQWKE